MTQRSPLVRSFGRALPRRSVRRVPAGRPQLPRYLRQFLRPTEVVDGRVREHVRNSGALLNREFAALAALDLLQQRLLDQVGTAARQRALALAVASLFLGGGKGHTVTLPLPTPLRQPRSPAPAGLAPGALAAIASAILRRRRSLPPAVAVAVLVAGWCPPAARAQCNALKGFLNQRDLALIASPVSVAHRRLEKSQVGHRRSNRPDQIVRLSNQICPPVTWSLSRHKPRNDGPLFLEHYLDGRWGVICRASGAWIDAQTNPHRKTMK